MIDFYHILELEFGASEAEIKAKFRILALKHHPDKNNGSKSSEAKFKEILSAYEILSDFDSRKKYDEQYLRNKHIGKDEFVENKTSSVKSETQTQSPNKENKFKFIFVLVGLVLLVLFALAQYNKNKSKKMLEESNRPSTGELF